ncbi:32655_t:CDS:1, partial [Gigaspora margarita]
TTSLNLKRDDRINHTYSLNLKRDEQTIHTSSIDKNYASSSSLISLMKKSVTCPTGSHTCSDNSGKCCNNGYFCCSDSQGGCCPNGSTCLPNFKCSNSTKSEGNINKMATLVSALTSFVSMGLILV